MAVTYTIEYRTAPAVIIRRTGSWYDGRYTVKAANKQFALLAEQVKTWMLFGFTVHTVEFGPSDDLTLYEVLDGLLRMFVDVANRESKEKLFAINEDGEPTGKPDLPEPMEGFLYG